ncbi:L-histidine N(alpha)-methyltransferase [Alteribacter lacisalsi]|nr:L-histidine N(alpha)-methyltransferase [Alteribacter lacisalsi]
MTKTDNSGMIIDLNPSLASFQKDVLTGLSRNPKVIAPKHFYDERGSRLFNTITTLSEYYPTRTEKRILRDQSAAIAAAIGTSASLVELGCGSEEKIELLISAVPMVKSYTPIDISLSAVEDTVSKLKIVCPGLHIYGLCADYTSSTDFLQYTASGRRVILFLGSTIGNFEELERHMFLENLRAQLSPDDGILIGIDLVKERAVLEAAYNDTSGVTAEFNLNMLERMNRELGAAFEVEKFRHTAFFNEEKSSIEMHLESITDQIVEVAGKSFTFMAGETVHTENSYKFHVEAFEKEALEAGLSLKKVWKDPQGWFALTYLEAAGK